jgi:hypothetical protein
MPTHIWTCNGNTVLKLFLRHVSKTEHPLCQLISTTIYGTQQTTTWNFLFAAQITKFLHWKMSCSRRIALTSSQIMVYMFVYSVVSSAQCHQCVHVPKFSKFSKQCLPLWSAPRLLPHWWGEFLHNSEIKRTKQVSSDCSVDDTISLWVSGCIYFINYLIYLIFRGTSVICLVISKSTTHLVAVGEKDISFQRERWRLDFCFEVWSSVGIKWCKCVTKRIPGV